MNQKVEEAKMHLIRRHNWIAHLIARLEFKPGNIAEIDLQGTTVVYSEKFVQETDSIIISRFLEHSLMHFIRGHHLLKKSNQERFNMAADLEVNDDIEGLPETALQPEQFGLPSGEDIEFYYKHLPDTDEPNSHSPSCGGDDNSPQKGTPPSDNTHTEDESCCSAFNESRSDDVMLEMLAQTSLNDAKEWFGKHPGTEPAWLQQALNRYRPQVDWRKLLNRYIGQMRTKVALGKSDYSYKRPSRRFANLGLIIPSLVTYAPKVAALVDVSGSTQNLWQQFLNEALFILRQFRASIYTWDVCLKEHIIKSNVSEFIGGGGTNLTPGILEMQKVFKPDILAVLTDGKTPIPAKHQVKTNILWVIYKNSQFDAEYGKIVSIP